VREIAGEFSFDDDRYQSAAIMTIGFKPVKGAKEEVCQSV
jgi:hypothetical protein